MEVDSKPSGGFRPCPCYLAPPAEIILTGIPLSASPRPPSSFFLPTPFSMPFFLSHFTSHTGMIERYNARMTILFKEGESSSKFLLLPLWSSSDQVFQQNSQIKTQIILKKTAIRRWIGPWQQPHWKDHRRSWPSKKQETKMVLCKITIINRL